MSYLSDVQDRHVHAEQSQERQWYRDAIGYWLMDHECPGDNVMYGDGEPELCCAKCFPVMRFLFGYTQPMKRAA